MRSKSYFALFATLLLMPFASFSQTPPPNDNFTNSITLTGSDVTFSGSLAGATIENSQDSATFNSNEGESGAKGSVWWNWTAPATTTLTLQLSDYNNTVALNLGGQVGIAVYLQTNANSSTGFALPALGYTYLLNPKSPRSLSVPVTAGSSYAIQLVGGSPGGATFRLVAQDNPVIVQQPRSEVVSSNECATLYVAYASLNQPSCTFQWQFNGASIAGETAPMLSLTNIDGSMAGAYTVIVSNATGFTVSDPATLTVSQTNFPVTLAPVGVGSNAYVFARTGGPAFLFAVTGEVGRNYVLQSSTNLVNWVAESDFPIDWAGYPTRVFFETNSPYLVAVPFASVRSGKYFRVAPYSVVQPHAAICINNLRQIHIAKLLWWRDYNRGVTATPADADIQVYFPHQTLPYCPDDLYTSYDTSYVTADLADEPLCKWISNVHIFEDPL